MSSLVQLLAAISPAVSYVITLTDETASGEDISGGASSAEAGFRFNSDGTLDKLEDGVYTQVNNSTDWGIPNSVGARAFYLRATEFSFVENETTPSISTIKNGTMGSWISVGNGNTREWSLDTNSNSVGAGNATWVIDVEIAADSGGANILDTGRFTMAGSVA